MPHCVRPVVLVALFLVGAAAPVCAQEADSVATDTATTDTATTDTVTTDTMTVDTATPDTTVRDTGDTAAAGDTTRTAAGTPRSDSLKAIRDSIQARRDSIVTARKGKARTVAKEWLELTDAGRFKESWEAADTTLQKGVSREGWIDQGRRARNRLDTMRSRTLARSAYRDSTTQIPGGHPVVFFQYETTFDVGEMLEAVVTTRRDTAWRVAGYRVVPPPDTTQADTVQTDTVQTDTTETDTTQEGDNDETP